MLNYSAAGLIGTCSPGSRVDSGQFTLSRANNIYSPGSDELTEMLLLMSTSCQARQPGNPILLYVEKPFLFSDLAASAAKSENKKRLFNV